MCLMLESWSAAWTSQAEWKKERSEEWTNEKDAEK